MWRTFLPDVLRPRSRPHGRYMPVISITCNSCHGPRPRSGRAATPAFCCADGMSLWSWVAEDHGCTSSCAKTKRFGRGTRYCTKVTWKANPRRLKTPKLRMMPFDGRAGLEPSSRCSRGKGPLDLCFFASPLFFLTVLYSVLCLALISCVKPRKQPTHSATMTDEGTTAVTTVVEQGGWRHFMSGTFAGMAGVLFGHPFDTVKVKISSLFTSPPSLLSSLPLTLLASSLPSLSFSSLSLTPPLLFLLLFSSVRDPSH